MKKLMKVLLSVMTLVLLFPSAVLQAEEAPSPVLSFSEEAPKEGDSTWNVSLNLAQKTPFTNGKIRITYNPDQLTLKSDAEGKILSSSMNVVNDVLTGTKDEGEIVLVFASSSSIEETGSLLEMEFALSSSVRTGDSIVLNAALEEFKNNKDPLELSTVEAEYTVGEEKGTSQTPGDSTQKPGSDKPGSDKKDPTSGSSQNTAASMGLTPLLFTGTAFGAAGLFLLMKKEH